MIKRVLVIAAHPDDEVLGCGATMSRHAKIGDEVYVCILAEGITSRAKERKRGEFLEELNELHAAARKANAALGVEAVDFYNFPDNRMDSLQLLDVVKAVEEAVNKYKPEIVYTHHAGDVNIDHQIVHKAVVTACRPLYSSFVNTLLFFEVLSSTEWQTPETAEYFKPNYFVDISETLNLKLEALKVYEKEMRAWPHSRSFDGVLYLARMRGMMCGTEAAEAFMLGRYVCKEGEQRV